MNRFSEKFRFSFIQLGVTTYCQNAPEEWNDNVIKWDRDKKNNSIVTKYVDNFTFVLDDADYLRNCFKQKGVFSKVRFVVEECDYDLFQYKEYYSGDIDFYSYEETDFSIKVSMFELGYKTLISSNLSTKYEIEIPQNADKVLYDRLKLKNVLEYGCEGFFDECTKNSVIDTFLITENVYKNRVRRQSVFQKTKNDDNWILQAVEDVAINVNIRLNGRMGVSMGDTVEEGSIRYHYFGVYVNNVLIEERTLKYIHMPILGSFGGGSFPISVYFNLDIDLKSSDKLYVLYRNAGGKTYASIFYSTINISFESRGNARGMYGLRPIELLTKLIAKATDNKYNLIKSSLLTETEMSKMLIMSGDMVRSISGAKIKTSLNDFFEAFKAITGACYTFDVVDGQERLVVEHINTFFNANNKIMHLTDVRDMKKTVASEYIYNTLKIGYKDNNYDEVNGRYEFNTELEFSTNTDVKPNDLKLISPYRADMYGVEFVIQNYEAEETKDSQSDNDVFIIHVGAKNDDGTYAVNRDEKSTNVLAGDSAFNIFLSPMHCLLRQIEYLKGLFKFSGSELKFTSSQKDFDMISEIGQEHKNVDLTAGRDLFTPIVYEFETRIQENISELIKTDYDGYIEVQDIAKGFILSASENPGRNKSQTWKLLELKGSNT